MSRFALGLLAVVLLLFALPSSSHAQVGATTDIITGTVVGPTGAPLAGATVEVMSLETEVTRSRTTNDRGQYTILFPDGGGQYRVSVRHIGMTPLSFTVSRQADEDRLVADARMTAGVQTLAAVTTTARRTTGRPDAPTAGSVERTLSGAELMRLPVDPSDINAIAALAPGVVSVAGTDTTPAGFSVAGQRPDQNQVTLDGMSFGGAGVPAEAVRTTRVITNTYDVSRGQFTGGQVATTTRGGTNTLTGSFGYNLHAPALELTSAADTLGSAFNGAYTRNQLSGGLGGAIVPNKLLWFASFQANRQTSALQSLLSADPVTLQRLGVQPDSAARFLALLGAYDIPLTVDGIPADRETSNATAITRLDYHINEDHSLTARLNWAGSTAGNYRSEALGIPPLGGDRGTYTAGALLSLASTLFDEFINEGRAYYERSHQGADPYAQGPEGRVRVTSLLSGGAFGVSSLDFGGNPGLPTSSLTDQLEISDELSWIRSGGHRWKLGVLLNLGDVRQVSNTNQNGTFTYNSLADFAANQPASFTRLFSPSVKSTGALNTALYLGDSWRHSAALQLVYGARLEHTSYRGAPADNPAVDSLFGLHTGTFPSELHLSPRVGFTWIIGAQNRVNGEDAPAIPSGGGRGGRGGGGRGGAGAAVPGGASAFGVLRGGIGEFRGRAPSSLFSSAIDATGLPSGETQLVCIGSAVPIPDWALYDADPTTLPTQCANGTGPGQFAPSARSNVTAFDPGFQAPRAWRASLGFQKRIGLPYSVSIDASYALGTALYGVTDLNLRDTAQFTLANEGNRPVFVPAGTIVPATGATSVLASRNAPQYAHVYDVGSGLQSRTAQVTATVNGIDFTNLIWSLSYTFQHARDQSSVSGGTPAGGFASPTTAGDPNVLEWATSSLGRTHNVQGTMTWMAKPWLDLTGVLGYSSGTPYTPLVGSDINGDGARNDRAFVFAPGSVSDTALANGMTRLLAEAPARARDCLMAQLDHIAARNSCVSDWTPRLDLQANIRPDLGGAIGQRLQLQVQLVNPLAGLDQLLHGAENLHGWGQASRVDPNLLFVRGFDPVAKAFTYQVNERFGNNPAARSSVFNPFQVALTGRLQVGPDMQRARTQALLRAIAGRGANGGTVDAQTLVSRVAPDPAPVLLHLADSLHLALTAAQADSVTAVGAALVRRDSVLAVSLQAVLDSAHGDLRAAFPALQPRLQAARADYVATVQRLRAVLTPAQWDQLPASFREPVLQPGGGGRGGGGSRPPQ